MTSILSFFLGAWGLGSIGAAVALLVAISVFGKAVPMWAWVLVIAALSVSIFAQRDLRLSQELDFERERKQLTEKALEAERKNRQQEADWKAKFAEADTKHTKEKNNALAENKRLRAALDAGTVGMRFNGAICPAPASDVPSAADSPSVDAGTTVELTPAARRAVSDLREALIIDRAKLTALQDVVRSLVGEPVR